MGLYCKKCRQRRGYNGPEAQRLRIGYEKFGATFRLIWYCPCGLSVGETVLS